MALSPEDECVARSQPSAAPNDFGGDRRQLTAANDPVEGSLVGTEPTDVESPLAESAVTTTTSENADIRLVSADPAFEAIDEVILATPVSPELDPPGINPIPELQNPTLAEPQSDPEPSSSDTTSAKPLYSPVIPELPAGTVDGAVIDGSNAGLDLESVITSVYSSYPLLVASLTQRERAAGQQLATWGAFDKNLSASTENKPVSFYENYRHKFRLDRNIYRNGGNWYAQYQLGRGDFEPWYLEREKNEGGEFQVGLRKPLLQGRDIDARRASIWRATYEMQRVEPAIQRDLITFVLDGSISYWSWVAAGQEYQLAQSLLKIAETRQSFVEKRVKRGDLPRPAIPENKRLVVQRKGVLFDAERRVRQAASQLSLFYRDYAGEPILLDESWLPATDDRLAPRENLALLGLPDIDADLAVAMASRPELFELEAQRAKLNVTLSEAANELMPKLDAMTIAAQDVGGRTSSKNDKQPFEFEASLFFEVPLERRRAKGRITDAQAQLAAVSAQLRMAQDRISVELQVAAAAIEAATNRVEAAIESIDLAKQLVEAEEKRFKAGEASLLELTLREQQLAASSQDLIKARFDLNVARANYRAALGVDRLPEQGP